MIITAARLPAAPRRVPHQALSIPATNHHPPNQPSFPHPTIIHPTNRHPRTPSVIPAKAGIQKSPPSSVAQSPSNGKTHRFPENRKALPPPLPPVPTTQPNPSDAEYRPAPIPNPSPPRKSVQISDRCPIAKPVPMPYPNLVGEKTPPGFQTNTANPISIKSHWLQRRLPPITLPGVVAVATAPATAPHASGMEIMSKKQAQNLRP